MNEWNIMEELGNIGQELLPKEPPKRIPWKRGALRLALIAAVLFLLAGTALGVSISVRVYHGQETVSLEGLILEKEGAMENSSYYTARVEWELSPQKAQIPESFRSCLTAAWEAFSYEYSYFSSAELTDSDGKRIKFQDLQALEELLSLKLMGSEDLDRLIRGVYVTLVISDPEAARAEYEQSHRLTPQGLLLICPLRRGEGQEDMLDQNQVAESSLRIYIPLSWEFARDKRLQTFASYEAEGDFQESGLLTSRGKSLLLLETEPREGYCATGYALWCSEGIAYELLLRTLPNTPATPLSILTPYLRELY